MRAARLLCEAERQSREQPHNEPGFRQQRVPLAEREV
jgi:hypothetical protein